MPTGDAFIDHYYRPELVSSELGRATVPDPSTRSAKKYTVRNTYSLEAWMDQAIIEAARKEGITQSEVVRECLEHGLSELYGMTRRRVTTRVTPPAPQPALQAPHQGSAADYTADAQRPHFPDPTARHQPPTESGAPQCATTATTTAT